MAGLGGGLPGSAGVAGERDHEAGDQQQRRDDDQTDDHVPVYRPPYPAEHRQLPPSDAKPLHRNGAGTLRATATRISPPSGCPTPRVGSARSGGGGRGHNRDDVRCAPGW